MRSRCTCVMTVSSCFSSSSGTPWSAVMTTSRSSSRWCPAWSSSASTSSWSVVHQMRNKSSGEPNAASVTPPLVPLCCFPPIQDVPYLDVAPYMPEYYKPQNLLDFEERLPSSDSLSLHSFTSFTSTNLEWDDSAIAPSSEGKTLWSPSGGFTSQWFYYL